MAIKAGLNQTVYLACGIVAPTDLNGCFLWTFETGSGSITTIPTDVSTSVIGNIVPPTSTAVASTFVLSELTPVDKATNQVLTTNQVVLEFNSDVDPATVTSETVTLTGKPVNDDTTLFSERLIYKDITVSGTQIIIDFQEYMKNGYF